jgi:hypothetical protein
MRRACAGLVKHVKAHMEPSYCCLSGVCLTAGCFTDDQVFDDSHTPPSPTQRRMWRRLGQQEGMDSWECAKRALAAGYPLFGVTSGEVFPAYGRICWWV